MAKPEENHSKWTTPAMINDSDVKNCASNCVALSTVFNGDDSTKLIIAQKGYFFKNMRLRAFDGLKQHSEYTLTDEPDALIALNNGPCEGSAPYIIVAVGPVIMGFTDLKLYHKYILPGKEANEAETAIWRDVENTKEGREKLHDSIFEIFRKESLRGLTYTSKKYLMSRDREKIITEYGTHLQDLPLTTCMGKMLKSVNEKKDILIVGTNHSKIVFINSENLTAFDEILLPSIPVSIHTHGTFDENYQLIVQTHDSIVSIKRGETEHKSIISRIVNTMVLFGTMVSLFKSIFVVYQLPLNRTKTSQIVYSSLENKIIFCNFEGEILNTVECQSRIKMLEPFFHSHKQLRAVIAVFGREIRFYDEKHMLDIVKFEKTIDWIKYGTYGKEEETLIVCFKDGTIAVQTFLETANFEHKMEYDSVPI